MKGKNSGPGFWTGVLAGMLFSWGLTKLRPDLNRILRAEYNLLAPHYEPMLSHMKGLEEVRQSLVDMLDLESGDHVLEVCVGTGANLPLIAPRIGTTGKIYGIDLSEGMLAEAQKKIDSILCPVELRLGNAEDLPYPDDSFDAVLNFGALNFISDRKKAIEEMVRVAKSGAKIVFGDETLAPDGEVQSLLSHVVLSLVPRLQPPLDLVRLPGAGVTYGMHGIMYLVEWRKPEEDS